MRVCVVPQNVSVCVCECVAICVCIHILLDEVVYMFMWVRVMYIAPCLSCF